MRALVFAAAMTATAAAEPPKKKCTAAPLTNAQVEAIIAKERSTRTDLPKPFAKSTWKVRRNGCYYTALELMEPATPDADHIFTLNQHGVIVDASALACPSKVYDSVELATIVTKARAAQSNLPPPYKKQEVVVLRSRCLYSYFEYPVPGRRGVYQLFQIDPLGDLMDVQIGKPY